MKVNQKEIERRRKQAEKARENKDKTKSKAWYEKK